MMPLIEPVGPTGPETTIRAPRPSRLMARICRDIGLAAVVSELELSVDGFEPELVESVKRGARYVYLMPKSSRESSSARGA
jgi:hypothetical protein